ncbi:hypothetical protein T07_14794 [Trichinella nelsoni]|uniref:Uncharacterized protein n=1 Tax=Trichinella nelsoni TaxID=6336 RepID=A0A0V0RIW5_9BILA|nr:hypothetical protein T07_14794 [Trichinella nelsoni]
MKIKIHLKECTHHINLFTKNENFKLRLFIFLKWICRDQYELHREWANSDSVGTIVQVFFQLERINCRLREILILDGISSVDVDWSIQKSCCYCDKRMLFAFVMLVVDNLNVESVGIDREHQPPFRWLQPTISIVFPA